MIYYELTPAQQNIADMQSFYTGTAIANICGAVNFESKLDGVLLDGALSVLLRRHEAFSLRFCQHGGRIVQYTEAPALRFPHKSFPGEEPMRAYCRAAAAKPFAADGGEMFRIAVLDLPESTGVMLCASHLIADGTTFAILARELLEIYDSLRRGEPVPDDHRSFTALASQQTACLDTDRYLRDLAWWTERYAGGISPSPVRLAHSASPASERCETPLGSGLMAEAEEFCAANGVSVPVLFETAVLLYLARINSSDTATIGVPVVGRATLAEKKTAGMFVTTVPLTVTIDGSARGADLCARVSAAHRAVFRRSRLSYRAIKECAGCAEQLYDVTVSCRPEIDVPARIEWFGSGSSEVSLAVHIGGGALMLEYRTDVFGGRDEAQLLAQRLLHIVRQLSGGCTVSAVSILPDEERTLTIVRYNDTASDYRADICVHEAFSAAAAAHPDKAAIIFLGKAMTYGRLDQLSDSLAAHLRGRGVFAGDIVPIFSRRSPYLLVAMLAVLKAGVAYMPVSPDYPEERQRYMAESVGARFVLTCGCECAFAETLRLDEFSFPRAEKLGSVTAPDDICYIVFTSGSTGRPKGTAITHRNVMNYCARSPHNVFGGIIKSAEARIVSVTDIVFDIFVTETLLPLINGMTLVLADDSQAVSQHGLSRLIEESGADIIQTTPTKMRGFLLDSGSLSYLARLKTIILGGEELPPALVRRLRSHTTAAIYNIYGPAETTVWSSFAEIKDSDDITIGRPIANTRIYLLDDAGEPVPVGVRGEIYISGDGVGAGYIGEPELTRGRFLPDRFAGGVMYRTGDMGLRRLTGDIEFLGRRDSLIKLRGLRIEPGEIESAMSSFEGILLAAVVCRKTMGGEQYLAGYYTAESTVNERALRTHLLKTLPAYMVPNRFVRLDSMPMTASGKLDRNALPEPLTGRCAGEYTAPANNAERQLCALIEGLLGSGAVGTEDDFFELGGDSFSAMALAAAAAEKGLHFSVTDVYEQRCVKKLCTVTGVQPCETALRRRYCRYPLPSDKYDDMLFRAFTSLTRRLYGFEVEGLSRLDPNEKYILCPNHASDLDCMWVWAAIAGSRPLDRRDICALIAAEHLDKRLSALIFRLECGIPIVRKGDFMPALRRASAVLKNRRRLLLIHPEGTRTRTGRLGRFGKGAALIAKRTGVKLVPVFIGGSGRIYPVTRDLPRLFDLARMRRFPLRIVFGEPIDPAGKSADELTAELRRRVLAMKKAHAKRHRK